MKKEHIFIKKDGNYWEVFCVKTEGSFNTKMWEMEKYPNKKCPCCGEIVK